MKDRAFHKEARFADAGNTDPPVGKLVGIIALPAVSFLFFYAQPLASLAKVWSHSEDYSYAFAIPLVSAYAVWKKRRLMKNTPVESDWTGGLLFLPFFIISIYGILGSSPSAVRPAIPCALLSIILLLFGWRQLRLLLFPIGLIFFMIPLPTVVETGIGVPLRFLSTRIGVLLLRILDVSVYVEGNIIDLGVTRLQVVDACSGLRYLLPLLALGVIFAYFFERSRWKQVLLVLSTVPIAVLLNGLRIAVTGYLAQHFGPNIADGFFHAFSGWLFFVCAILMLVLLHFLLDRFVSDDSGNDTSRRQVERSTVFADGGDALRVSKKALGAVCFLLIGGGVLNMSIAGLPPVQVRGGFDSFRLNLEGWEGRSESVDPRIIERSGAQEAINAAFFSPSGGIVSLYMGFRSSSFTESENFFHSPDVCMPSLGWKTIEMEDHVISEIPEFGRITVRKMMIEKAGARQLVYYWFQTKTRTAANVHQNRFHLTLHALQRDNTYDLFIRPITPLDSDETSSGAQERLDRFTRRLLSALLPFLAENAVVPGATQ